MISTARPLLSVFLGLIFTASVAQAAQRTFVSAANGSDANECSRANPCRNFARAMQQTDGGGEVVVLDSGGYGAVTINQSVSLTAPAGVYAGVTAFSGNAVTVAPTLNIATVVIRGLTLNGLGGDVGIDHSGSSGGSENNIYIENCLVANFAIRGLNLPRNARFFISDTILRKNGDWGVFISGGSGAPSHASLRNVIMERNGHGGLVVDNADVVVRDSIAVSNQSVITIGIGFYARAENSGDQARISLDHCQASHQGTGFRAGIGGTPPGTAVMFVANSHAAMNVDFGIFVINGGAVRVSNTTVVRNATGFQQVGSGVFESRGNNNLRGNVTEKNGTISLYSAE